ncbi:MULTISPECIES: hypothetical protein [unclassified Arthrobacter]|uniref:hypothetical protein n=1 Tax=unclassified Arthrobacter TaxID=235627 RepID=UPI001E35398B|nr:MULTISPECIES: hypothetical protein [unclassified Arthrobacter]MCC9146448.1 hypothetical protein [Arthrobacter sp. zg-Y919]MDK1277678.1 hypothetical protein [Arthrobacter sp. zg.Y919]WIB02362.1 hypothetical protein QNO10_10370 [Arthrobacter sp. zg-Y919]
MRWDALFRDMEAQMAAAAGVAVEGEIAERVRIELRGISLQDRLRSQCGKHLVVDLGTAGLLQGILRHVGEGWLVLERDRGAALAVLAHVVSIKGMDRFASQPAETVRLGVASALRGIARDRSAVVVRSVGSAAERALHGTIDRVGNDFLELAALPSDQPRRPANVTAAYVLPMATVAAVLSQQSGWD